MSGLKGKANFKKNRVDDGNFYQNRGQVGVIQNNANTQFADQNLSTQKSSSVNPVNQNRMPYSPFNQLIATSNLLMQGKVLQSQQIPQQNIQNLQSAQTSKNYQSYLSIQNPPVVSIFNENRLSAMSHIKQLNPKYKNHIIPVLPDLINKN